MDKSRHMLTESYYKESRNFTSDGNIKLIGECLQYYADTQGNKEAVVFASSDGVGPRQVVTYKELYETSLTTGKSIRALGVKPGEIVAVNIRPCPEWLFMAFGTILAGARFVGISFMYADGSDLISIMEKLEKCALLAVDPGVDGNNWEIVRKMVDNFNQEDGSASSKKMPYLRYLIAHEFPKNVKIKSVNEFIHNEDHAGIELPLGTEDDIVVLFQTSGSTGVPKLVAHTHKSLLYYRTLPDSLLLNKDQIYFINRPFEWMGGFPNSIFLGKTRVLLSGFGPVAKDSLQRRLDVISEERCTVTLVLPFMLDAMIRAQDRLPSNWSLEVIITGGQPLTKTLSQSTKVCNTLANVYGATEFNYISASEKRIVDQQNCREFDCGRLLCGSGMEIKVVDKYNQIVPINVQGQVLVKSPSLFKEYFNDSEKTAATFDEQGWFKTDDLGRINESGEIFIDGRCSNMIISGAMNVVPEIIERAIQFCPGVEAVVVVPVPDEVYYQVLCACVSIKNGSPVTENDLRKYCDEFHNDKPGLFTVLPRFYLFVDSFPQTRTGKTSRKALQELAQQTFAHSSN